MKIKIQHCLALSAGLLLALAPAHAAPRAMIDTKCSDPYLGAIVTDADTGQILFEDRSDTPGYPASVLKLMDLLVFLEKIEAGTMRLDERITVSAEVSRIGGSQVWLKENESFTVEELLYAFMVQSANDAAAALAIHAAGSREAFVALMNKRAAELGMKSSSFHSIHGLPPEEGQQPDVTTARDIARLARELLLKHPDCLRYTSCKERPFRGGNPIMRNHNGLLWSLPGCDGLKTGYFKKAGYSIAATVKRDNTRLIVVVLGSISKQVRDKKAVELALAGFAKAPPKPAPPPAITNIAEETPAPEPEPTSRRGIWTAVSITLIVLLAGAAYRIFFFRPEKNDLVQKR